MAKARSDRDSKRQLGQFLTPDRLAESLVAGLDLFPGATVLEPGFGEGAFVMPLAQGLIAARGEPVDEATAIVFGTQLHGVEMDFDMYAKTLAVLEDAYPSVDAPLFAHDDFFRYEPPASVVANGGFDLIVGNPPFGGTFDPEIEDALDRQYGFRNGNKIKKETYAFFIVKSLDMLRPGGRLRFICSDTFLTINTMQGLRRLLMDSGSVSVSSLSEFSEETTWGMVVLDVVKGLASIVITVNDLVLPRAMVERTQNFSWQIDPEMDRYFGGGTLGDVIVGTSGMTTGKNEWFVKDLDEFGTFVERYDYDYFDDPITLAGERDRARLGNLNPKASALAEERERQGETRRSVRAVLKDEPITVHLPDSDYCYYNRGGGSVPFYTRPTSAIYWKDDGDAVKTFKKAGRWYLHGVGGGKHFKREGITWPLIAGRIYARYLPAGYILDSGSPCAFLRPGIAADEMYFVLGWLNTRLCSEILKRVINHTANIQGKDIERLPYPYWVDAATRSHVVALTKTLVERARHGERIRQDGPEALALDAYFGSENWSASVA